MIIYKIENKINGKIYIGQTKEKMSKSVRKGLKLRKELIVCLAIKFVMSA
jgi:hypothetical protein